MYRKYARLAVVPLVLAGQLVFGASLPFPAITASASTWTDSLQSTSLNSALWSAQTVGSGPTVSPSGSGLGVSLPSTSSAASGNFLGGVVSTCVITGDFDAQVDYSLSAWPAANGARIGLVAPWTGDPWIGFGGAAERSSFSSHDDYSAGEEYVSDWGQPPVALVSTSDTTGSLRLVRSGSSVSAYYGTGGGGWSLIGSGTGSAAATPLALRAWSDNAAFNHAAVTVAFTNFTLNSGTCRPQSSDRYGRIILQDHPMGYWRLAESSGGTAFDSSGNDHDGSYHGSVLLGQAGLLENGDPDSSASFNGGYVDLGTLNLNLSSVTLEAWVDPTAFQATSPYIDSIVGTETSADTNALLLRLGYDGLASNAGKTDFVATTHQGASVAEAKAPMAVSGPGTVHHVVGVFSNPNLTVYVDGNVVATATASPTDGNTYGTGDYWIAGNPLFGRYLTGLISNVAIYPSALTAQQVRTHYLASGRTEPPVGGPVLPSQAAGGGANNTRSCSSVGVHGNATSSPVDTESGNFWHTFTDVSIAGRSCPLEVTRTYNSQNAAANSPFGYGWQYNYAMSLAVSGSSPNQLATLTQENGSQATFSQPASGNTWPPSAPRVIAALTHNADGSWTLTRQARDTYTFNAGGQLMSITDLNGYVTALSYTGGNLSTVTDPAGRTLSFGWTAGNITMVTDASVTPSRTVTYTYDGSGDLQDVVDVNGGDTHFTYDGGHRMLTMKDPKCEAQGTSCPGVQNDYDSGGRVDWQKDQLNRQTLFAYAGSPGDATGGSTTTTDPKGNVTVEGYAYGVRLFVTRAWGTAQASTTNFQYDAATLALTGVLDPNGHLTTQTVDSNGNVLTTTDALGRTTTTTYNSHNELLTLQDGNGVTTTMTYDSHGNLQSTSRPLVGSTPAQSQVMTYDHDDSSHPGDVTRMVDPAGKTSSYSYDTYGNRTSVTDPVGDESTTTFNAADWMLTKVSPKGNVVGCNCAATYTTTYGYVDPDTHATNEFGDVATVSDPLGHVTVTKYDADRNVISAKDQKGNTTSYTFDLANEQTDVVRADATSLTTDYNADGSVLDQKDGKTDAIQTYGYDPAGRVASVTDALGNLTSYTYDAAGNRLTQQDPGGNCAATSVTGCTTFSYDAGNELTSVTYSDGVTPNVTGITYDLDGQRTAVTDGSGTWSWSRDSLHRLTSVTEGANGTLSYQYDLRNLVQQVTYPGGHTVNRGYDNAGRWTTVSDWAGNTTTFSYDANSNVTTETLPSATGVVDTFGFDAANRLTSISDLSASTTTFAASYTRDAVGQLAADSSAPSGSASYRYTGLNQLCYAASASSAPCSSPPTGATAYGFDVADNLTTDAGTAQTFNTADELCWTVSGSSTSSCDSPPSSGTQYVYDTRGNRTATVPSSGPTTTLAYDQANRLVEWSSGSTTATYGYSADGLRMSKTMGATTTSTLWDLSGGLPLILKDGSIAYVTGPGGLPLEQINGSTVLWLHHDQLGSTRFLTDATGSVQATYTFEAFGKLVASTGSVTNPFRFGGQYQDAESGLYDLRARYYDPVTAQFVSRDPVASVTRQPYDYVTGDPLNETDPTGLCGLVDPWNCVADAGGAVISQAESWAGDAKDAGASALSWASDHLIPDYVTVTVGAGVPIPLPGIPAINVGGQVTITRDGHVYVGVHAGAGTPGPSGFLGVGYLNGGSTTSCDRDDFVGDWGVVGHGQLGIPPLGNFGPGGSLVYGTPGQGGPHATGEEYGVGWGNNASISGSYNWRL